MKRHIPCFLLVLFLAGCAAGRMYDMREFPSYRLGVVQAGWMDPNLHLDVWVNSRPNNLPSFTLLPGWQKEWEAEADDVSIYAEAWIWDKGRKLVVAKTKLAPVKVSVARDWNGHGWRVMLSGGDFVALR